MWSYHSPPSNSEVWWRGTIPLIHNTGTWRLKAGIVEPEETSIARQLFGKHVPTATSNNGTIVERWCFLWVRPDAVFRGCQASWEMQVEFRESLEMAVENDIKKGIRLWEEDLCVLQWQWDYYKSVARIRLVKTENTSACVCVTVNCKVCRSAIALYYL
jgi:hypothetical protein